MRSSAPGVKETGRFLFVAAPFPQAYAEEGASQPLPHPSPGSAPPKRSPYPGSVGNGLSRLRALPRDAAEALPVSPHPEHVASGVTRPCQATVT